LAATSNNTIINNSIYNNTGDGLALSDSSNSTLIGNLVYNNSHYGFYILNSSNITLINNTAYNNTQRGIILESSSNNNISDNIAYNNNYNIQLYSNSNNNILANNIVYATDSDLSQYGIILYSSSNNTLTNNTAYNHYYYGIYLYSNSNNNNLTNNAAYNNLYYGFILSSSSNNTLTNNLAYNNLYHGFYLYSNSNYNTLINNSAYGNSQNGFYLYYNSNYNTLTDNSAYNNSQYGIYIDLSDATNITNAHLFKNTYGDFYITTDGTPRTVYLSNVTFDNPAGNYENYTILSIVDTVEANTAYRINWTQNSSALPTNYISFANKFVDITTVSGSVSIDSISWSWLDSELSGYNENIFELWKYNSSGWTLLNNTPDTVNNRLSLTNMNPLSTYGILQNENCPVITSPGQYTQAQNYVGAPNSASPLSGYACVKIASSNVVYDCNGYNITNNGTAGTTYGLLLNGSLTNVTIRNCNVGNYTYGIYVYSSSNNNLTNNSAYNNSQHGFYLHSSSNNTLTNDFAYNNSNGFYFYNGSNYTTLVNSFAYNNAQYGVFAADAHDIALFNNTAHDEDTGFMLAIFNSYVFNNTAYNTAADGFYLDSSSNNSLADNTAYNNTDDGFYLLSSHGNNFTNNVAYENDYGFVIILSHNNAFVSNSVHSNSQHGFYLSSSSNNNLTNNTVYNNSQYQIYLQSSNYNLIYNNIFNASTGQGVVYDSGSNYWNTTKDCSGTNIIGGDCIGGNFYSNYSGVDINGDGIGDIPPNYSIYGGSNFDYLPLTNNYSPNTPPVVNLLSPADGYSTTNTTIRFEFNATDDYSTTLSCSLYINGTLNQTNSSVQNNTNTTFTQTFAVGTYNWSINCTDGYNSTMSEGRILNITLPPDTPPTITLISPSNGYTSYSTTVTHVFRAVDDYSATLNCSLWINGSINQTNESVANNTNTNFVVSYALGNYVWWVNCSDGSMTNVSETRNLSVRQRPSGGGGGGGGEHDLYISSIDHQYAKMGETKNVLIIVENTGDYTETNVKLTLVCPASFSCGNATLGSIGEGKEKNATISIKGTIVGDYTLKAEARSDDAYAYREFYFTVQPECERNSDCANDEKCSNGVCVELSCGEGYTIKDHSCVKITPEEENVSENITHVFNLTMVEEAGNVGGEFVLLVLMDGEPAEGIPVVVEFPNRMSNIFYSDENGYVRILADQAGEYTFYIKDYSLIKVFGKAAQRPSISIKPSTTEQPKPEEQPKAEAGIHPLLIITVGLLLLFMIILAWYFLRRRR
jgi:parallel beta-helix repeat protein